MPELTTGPGSAAEQVQTTLFRALAGLRGVVLLYALVLNVVRFDEFARPVAAGVAMAVMVCWSGFVTWAYEAPSRRGPPLLVADLAVATGLILSTPYIQTQEMLERHASTMPSFWVMVAVLAWAIARGWVEGIVVAAVVSLADVSIRTAPSGVTWGNVFLLLLAAGVVGYASQKLREAAEIRAAAERSAAAYEERARLARAVHDGVLQVLALVQRAAEPTAADELAELGRLAGEQEVALRALVQGEVRRAADDSWQADLAAGLGALQSARVTVSAPGGPVPMPSAQVEELVAVVGACLDNVRHHVGAEAPAWVLLEDLGSSVVVSVRDQGPGIEPGRLERARAEGRLGVSESIRGRMAVLGGTAELLTGPGQGTEWELTVPRAGR